MANDLKVTTVVRESKNGKPYVTSFIEKGSAPAKPAKSAALPLCTVCKKNTVQKAGHTLCYACYKAARTVEY